MPTSLAGLPSEHTRDATSTIGYRRPEYSISDMLGDLWSSYTEHRRGQVNPLEMNQEQLLEYMSGFVGVGAAGKVGKPLFKGLGKLFSGTKQIAPKSMTRARVPRFGDTQEAMKFGKLATREQVTEAKFLRSEAIRRSQKYLKTDPDRAMREAVEGQFYREMLEEYYKKLGMKYKE